MTFAKKNTFFLKTWSNYSLKWHFLSKKHLKFVFLKSIL